MSDKTRTTEEIIKQVWNSITSNGCREMDEVRFQQACLEFKQLILNGRKSNEEIREMIKEYQFEIEVYESSEMFDYSAQIKSAKEAIKALKWVLNE